MTGPQQVNTGIEEVKENADRLGLTWALRPGTISAGTTATSNACSVIMDGDTSPIPAFSMVGGVSAGLRVYVLRIQPEGSYIAGFLGPDGSYAAFKSASEGRANAPAVADDADLTLGIASGLTCEWELILLVTSNANAAGDFLFQLGWSGSAVVNGGVLGLHNTLASGSAADLEAAGRSDQTATPIGAFVTGASTSTTMTVMKGTLVTASFCQFTLAWGQFSSNGNATNLLKGSSFTIRRLTPQ